MKGGDTSMSVMSNTLQSLSSQSFNSNTIDKYNGLIKLSMMKRVRNALSGLYSYIYQIAPTFKVINYVITVFRLLQFVGPSLAARFEDLWGRGTLQARCINIICIFFHLIPVTERDQGALYFTYAYLVLQILYFIILGVAAFYFRKTANLPTVVTNSIAFYNATFIQVLPPIAVEFIFEMVSELIFAPEKLAKGEMIMKIVFSVISFIVTVITVYITTRIANQTLTFRPISLITVSIKTQNLVLVQTLLITGVIALAAYGTKIVNCVCLGVGCILYFVSTIYNFLHGGFIESITEKAYFSSAITGGIMCIIFIVFGFTSDQIPLVFVFIIFVLWILCFIISNYIFVKIKEKRLILLDQLGENSSDLTSYISSPNKFMNVSTTGFEYAHYACIDWRLFKIAVEVWPEHQGLWYMFAKFVAIYPEGTQLLSWIFRTIITNKIKGSMIRCIKEQCLSITRQREGNLSPELKMKLNNVNKQVQGSKHKLRHVWDVVIQGNINEVEDATKRAIKSIEQNDADFQRLLRQFPNNRFVTRTYSRFLQELAADSVHANEMIDKTRLLHRGIAVNADQTHEFGLAVFQNLPEAIENNVQVVSTSMSVTDTQSTSMDVENDDTFQIDIEQYNILQSRIESVSVPAIKGTLVLRYIFLLVFFLAPLIALLVYASSYIKDLATPLSFISDLAQIRTSAYQIAAFSYRQIYITLGYIIDNQTDYTRPPPTTVGNSWNITEQLKFILGDATSSVQTIASFRTYKQDDPNIAKAQALIFKSSVDYTFYTTVDNFSNTKYSIQGALMEYVVQISTIYSDPSVVKPGICNTSIILNPSSSLKAITGNINDALQYIDDYLQQEYVSMKRMVEIIMICVIIVIVIVFIALLIAQIKWIKSNKEQVYRCLTSLPKNTVSSLAENLRVLKRDNGAENSSTNTNTEVSKQEENILKIFSTGGSSNMKMADMIILIITTLLIIGLHIACTILLCNLFESEIYNLRTRSPHLNYLHGAYSLKVGAIYTLYILSLFNTPERIVPLDRKELTEFIDERCQRSRTYYHLARFGSSSSNQNPFEGFTAGLKSSFDKVKCEDQNAPATSYLEVAKCFNADVVYTSLQPIIYSILYPYNKGVSDIDPNDQILGGMWDILIFPLYDAFFSPMFDTIIPTITNALAREKNNVFPPIIAMVIIAVLVELVATIQIKLIEKHIRSVLHLLLHSPPQVVMQTQKIVTVLGGDFSAGRNDIANRDTEFFDKVFSHLPDAIVYADVTEKKIEATNKLFSKMFNAEDDIKGQSLVQFMEDKNFKGEYKALFEATSTVTKNLEYNKPDETVINIAATAMITNQKLVISFRDTTQTVRYNALIHEERMKSDRMLSSILPPSLVKRVQAGEKNISFAVQSATIVFMDIVSFTPWCGSLPADKVMMTLNLLFKKFDAACAKQPTMTKIKCIGDCYMAAGGVFDEINQPAQHATEVVNFGLDALESINELNAELNEKLQIRVGVNTGGPIVAGVLGIGKPTFEILGPAINMAQQMEHHGVPMMVHVSRSVYELIYGGSFKIKERGSVEVKGGSVITYLVVPPSKK